MTATSPAQAVASTEAIRANFPALERMIRGEPVAYFDAPGGTQVPRVVADAVHEYLLHHNANTHWAFPTSEETDAAIAAARAALADLLGASPGEISFGANMTTITFHVARALGRSLGPGDEIVVTELDHNANVDPWRALARERGVTIRVAAVHTTSGELDWSDLERCVNARTRVLAIGAASNALGTITDVRRAAELARSVGAVSYVDAVHYAPHVLPDVRQIGCDFLACSAYKFYGPHVGVLFGRGERLASLDVPKLLPASDSVPERMETGTQNHEGIAGAAAAVDFLASLAPQTEMDRRARLRATYAELHRRGDALLRALWEGLATVPGVTTFGPPPGGSRTATIAFALAGFSPVAVARHLAARGVFVSHGDFYASTVVQRLGYGADGLVRAGCVAYTSMAEVERLVDGVAALATR
jgi:cysteine desulfurase family protein (TIGR01976 family)